jgi:hypothetical protein
MSKGIIEFTLPEEEKDFKRAMLATNAYLALFNIWDSFDGPDSTITIEKFNHICEELGVDFLNDLD